jgi:hypothetical protein
MPEHDDDTFPTLAQQGNPATNQLTANPAPLMTRQDRHWSQ